MAPFKKNMKRKTYRKKRSPKVSFDKRVLSVVNKGRELKTAINNIPVNTDVFEDIIQQRLIKLFPDIPQGVNEYQRVGNSILLKKLVVRGYYKHQFPDAIPTNARAIIRHMVLKQRNCNSADNILTGQTAFLQNTFLEQASAYLGNIESFQTPINKSAFIVRKDMKKINTFGSLNGPLSDSYWLFEYTLTFGKGKLLNYRTSGASQPADFPYFLAHSAASLGSNVGLSANTITFNMTTTAYYYDA